MHFSIPDTQEFIDATDNTYVVNISVISCILLYINIFTLFLIPGLQHSHKWIISLYCEI